MIPAEGTYWMGSTLQAFARLEQTIEREMKMECAVLLAPATS